MNSRKLILSIFVVLCLNCDLLAQVTIAPTNLFIDSNNKFGTFMVINGSNQAQEISVEFYFSYNKTDENGNRTYINDDSLTANTHSVSDFIRAFPQNFILEPNTRQIIRVRITAPNDLESGTYWSRVKTTSTNQAAPIELGSDDAVSARIGVVFEQITSLFYKVGDVNTRISISDIETELSEEGILTLLTHYEREGNSPFLGTITANLKNNNGNVVRDANVSTTLHFSGVQRHTINIQDLESGTYNVEVTFDSRRSDVSSSDLVQMEPVTKTTTVTIP